MNLTIGDMFKTWSELDVLDFFECGLRWHNVVVTLSALEELMKRDEIDLVGVALSCYFNSGLADPGDNFYTAMTNSLAGYGRRSKALKEAAKRMRRASSLSRVLQYDNIPNGTSQEEISKKIQDLNREIIALLNDDEYPEGNGKPK